MTKTETIAQLEAEIATERQAHTKLNAAVVNLTKSHHDLERNLSLLLLGKEESRRRLARLRKAKRRAVTGRNNS